MQWIKTALLAVALCVSFNAAALTDDEEAVWREAVVNGELKTIEKFLDEKIATVDEKIFGWSSVQLAANANQEEVVTYLVSKGADIDYMQPYAHHTAFHVAAFKHYYGMMELLKKSGADINIKLRDGLSIVQFFRDEGDQKMVDYLISLGVKDDGCKGGYC